MAKLPLSGNKKVIFGTKVSGRHKKKYGPKEQRPKKYNKQGRT